MRASTLFACILSFPLLAQKPVINPGGVVNAATFVTVTQPTHALGPGSIASIFGQNLAVGTASAPSTPLPQTLAGTSVTVGGIAAPLFYVSPTQINFQVPHSVPWACGEYTQVLVVVTTAAGSSDAVSVDTFVSGAGIFTLDGSGCGRGAVLNARANGKISANSPVNSASPGDFLAIFATGGGVVLLANGPAPDGVAPSVPERLLGGGGASIDGEWVVTSFAGRVPGLVGVDQFNVQIPKDAREGCAVPVTVSGLLSQSQPVTVSIHKGGGQCVDPPVSAAGEIRVTRSAVANSSSAQETDMITASFPASPGKRLAPTVVLPPGAYFIGGTDLAGPACPVPGYANLSAGAITVKGPGVGTVQLQPSLMNGQTTYQTSLPAGSLQSGTYEVSSAGGTEVGPFHFSIKTGSEIQVSSQFPAGYEIDDSKPLAVRWTGGKPGDFVTVKVIDHQFLGDIILWSQVPSSDGMFTFEPVGDTPTLSLPPSSNVEIVVSLETDVANPVPFSANGLALGGRAHWSFEHHFTGLVVAAF